MLRLRQKASDAGKKPKVVDEQRWASNVSDLTEVLQMAQNLFVGLEHGNEALLRVAVEIATCKHARKCCFWQDNWVGNHGRREQVKSIVKDKLAIVLAAVNSRKGSDPDGAGAALGQREVEALRRRSADQETRFKEEQQMRKVAEMRCQEAEEDAGKAQSRIQDLERSLEQMRQELRKRGEGADEEAKLGEAERARLAKAAAEQEARLADLERRLQQADQERLAAEKERVAAEKQRIAAEKQRIAAEQEREAARQQLDAAQKSLRSLEEQRKEAGKTMAVRPSACDKCIQIEAERKELAAQVARLESKLESEAQHSRASQEKKEEVAAMKAASERESEELRCEKLKEKLAKKNAEIETLKQDKEHLEEQNLKMLKTLRKLREQILKLTEIAEKKGYGTLVAEIMEESGLLETINSDEYMWYDRLYDDALRRQEKYRQLEHAIMLAKQQRPHTGCAAPPEAIPMRTQDLPGLEASRPGSRLLASRASTRGSMRPMSRSLSSGGGSRPGGDAAAQAPRQFVLPSPLGHQACGGHDPAALHPESTWQWDSGRAAPLQALGAKGRKVTAGSLSTPALLASCEAAPLRGPAIRERSSSASRPGTGAGQGLHGELSGAFRRRR